VDVYPDEITPDDHFDYVPRSTIFDEYVKNNADSPSYQVKLEKEQYPLFHHPVGTYYKDELPYYGPPVTYKNIPNPEDEGTKYIVRTYYINELFNLFILYTRLLLQLVILTSLTTQ